MLISLTGLAHSAIVVPDVGATAILTDFFVSGADVKLHLFCTDVTPADTDVVGTYTACAGGGYAVKTLTAASWTVSTVSNIVQAAYAIQVFTFTGSLTTNGTIYGYYVTDSAGTTLLFSEKAAATFTPANNGDTYSVTPTIQLSKGTPN